MKLTGLDLKTANSLPGSICSVGCAVLEDGVVTEKREYLVRPHKSLDHVTAACYNVHGISYYDLREAPEFPEIWPVLGGMLREAECVAFRDASLSFGHLRAVLALYRLPAIRFPCISALDVCRKKHPETGDHFPDETRSFFEHNIRYRDALEDAISCAKLLSKMKFEENDVKMFDFYYGQ